MKPLHLALLLLTVAVWGFNFVAMRVILEVFTPGQLAFTRSALTVLFLLPFWKPQLGLPWNVAASALAIGSVSFFLLYTAVEITDSLTTVAVTTQLMPPLSAVLALLFYRESISPRKGLGIGIATLGALYLAGATESRLSVTALGLTLTGVLFYAAGSLVIGKSTGIGIWRILAWTGALSLPPLGLWVAASGPLVPDIDLLETRHWLSLLLAVAGAGLAGQAVLFKLYRLYPVSDVTPWVLLLPLFTGLSAVVAYGERISLPLLLGGGVVLAGVWIQQHRPGRPPATD